ncbi:MAG TPA: insulinase family protein [Thermoanaerobaculia bacterium]|nr:insulinase family protein [Thermoanaerobaculia bacterium]
MVRVRKAAVLPFLLGALALAGQTPAGPKSAAKPRPKAQAKPETPKSSAPTVVFEKFVLPNGLQVILHVDRKLPIVHVNEWFHVGSKNEKPGRTGFAHLFEHEMFEGSRNAPGKYFGRAEQAGANLAEGGVNGTTNTDRTNYFITVPSGSLEYVLWLESDRLATLGDYLTKENLDAQRAVVKNERRQGLENQPYGRAFKLMSENLFPAGHPYSWPVIGSHEDLTAASLEDVQDFFKTWYTPNNVSLVIAGDFDPAQARRLVEKYFGGIPAGPPLDRPERWVPTLSGEKIVEATDRVPQERVYMVWPSPPFYTPGDAELDLTSLILTDGLASRLQKVLVYDRQLCTAVSAFQQSMEISSLYAIIATARPGASLAEIEKIVTAEISRLAKEGPTAAELARAKTKWEFTFVTGLERIGGFGGKADLLNSYNTFLGDPGRFDFDRGRYANATADDVRKAVARWLDTGNRLLVRFHPEKSGRASETVLDRSKPPALGADTPFHAPEVKSAKLSNGLEVFVVERRELPKVAVTLAARAGSVADPAGKEGAAYLTAVTMPLGTGARPALAIETAFGDLGTTLSPDTQRESSRLSMEVLKRNLASAVELMADVVRNPTFPESEVEREKKRHLDALAQQEKNGGAVAARIRSMLVFGPDHPYGRAAQGLRGTIERITRADLAAFHRTQWTPGGSALVFAGDVTLAEARSLAEKAFGSWSGGAPPEVAVPPASPAPGGRIYLVDRQDSAQTVVTQAMAGLPRSSPDYFALELADGVWGGGAASRLDMNLREDKGYSYGVFSVLRPFSKSGVWFSVGGVQTDKTKESVAEFDKEMKAIAGGRPITPEEFEFQKLRILRGYAQQFEALSRVVGQVADLWTEGLPMTELQREYDEIGKLTLAAARAAAEKYAQPGKAALVLVGDRAKIGPGVQELKIGEVVVLDVEGKPAAPR